MANTFSQIYLHVIFAVEGRQSLIEARYNDRLQKYITGIVTHQHQKLIAINNMPDHMHLLIGLKPTVALSDLVAVIKGTHPCLSTAQSGYWADFRGRKALEHSRIRIRSSGQSFAISRISNSIIANARSSRSIWTSCNGSKSRTINAIYLNHPNSALFEVIT